MKEVIPRIKQLFAFLREYIAFFRLWGKTATIEEQQTLTLQVTEDQTQRVFLLVILNGMAAILIILLELFFPSRTITHTWVLAMGLLLIVLSLVYIILLPSKNTTPSVLVTTKKRYCYSFWYIFCLMNVMLFIMDIKDGLGMDSLLIVSALLIFFPILPIKHLIGLYSFLLVVTIAGLQLFTEASVFIQLKSIFVLLVSFALSSIFFTYHFRNRYFQWSLKIASETDILTGVLNRRGLEVTIQEKIKEPMQTTVAIIDIDNFKLFNDFCGHAKGDEILQILSSIISSEIAEKNACVSRYGGEEFVLVFFDCHEECAPNVLENIRRSIYDERIVFKSKDFSTLRLSISIGYVSGEIKDIESMRRLIRKADKALNTAKMDGKNKIATLAKSY